MSVLHLLTLCISEPRKAKTKPVEQIYGEKWRVFQEKKTPRQEVRKMTALLLEAPKNPQGEETGSGWASLVLI